MSWTNQFLLNLVLGIVCSPAKYNAVAYRDAEFRCFMCLLSATIF